MYFALSDSALPATASRGRRRSTAPTTCPAWRTSTPCCAKRLATRCARTWRAAFPWGWTRSCEGARAAQRAHASAVLRFVQSAWVGAGFSARFLAHARIFCVKKIIALDLAHGFTHVKFHIAQVIGTLHSCSEVVFFCTNDDKSQLSRDTRKIKRGWLPDGRSACAIHLCA